MKYVITQKQYNLIISEQKKKSLVQSDKFAQFFKNYLDKIGKNITIQQDDKDSYDVIQFVNGDGKLLFRYTPEQRKLLYSIDNVLTPVYMSITDAITIDDYRFLDIFIKNWVEENLVPQFNDEIEEDFGEPFEIDDCYSDEDYYEWKKEQEDNPEEYDN